MYIGLTKRSLHDRFLGHCKINQGPLASRIKIYGRENYIIIPIDYAKTKYIGFIKEEFWTRFYKKRYKLYNTRIGTKCSEKERLNLKEKLKGRVCSKETLQKMKDHRPDWRGELNPMYGKHHSAETKLKIGSRSYGSISGKNNVNAKRVHCITTDLYFDTVKSAGRYYGISDNTIRYVINNYSRRNRINMKSGKGLEWEYA